MTVPGHEGTIGPFPHQYSHPHVYARDIHSGAGNCVCGSHLGHDLHTQAAPGVPIPGILRTTPHPAAAHRERPTLIIAPDYATAETLAHAHAVTGRWTHVGDLDAYKLRGTTPDTARIIVDDTAHGMWNWPQLRSTLTAAGFDPDRWDGQ